MRTSLVLLSLFASFTVTASAQTPLPPIELQSVHDAPPDGAGDSFNGTPFEGLIRNVSSQEDRALQRFDASGFIGQSISSATLSGTVFVNNAFDNGLRTFDFVMYDDAGPLAISDFQTPATLVGQGSYSPPTETSFVYSFDVTALVQGFIASGTGIIGLRVEATSSPNFPNILDDTTSVLSISTGVAPTTGPYCFGDVGASSACTPCPCGNDAPPVAISGGCLNGVGTFCILNGNGSASASADTQSFNITGANPSTFAVLVSGANRLPTNPANPCFGLDSGVLSVNLDGLRCSGGNLVRHGSRATDAFGVNTNPWGPPGNPMIGLIAQGGFSIGESRHFQCFYREEATLVCQTGQNTSNGWSIVVAP